MNILSFEQGHREQLLERADVAQRHRHFREAYDLLREALRFGEDASIFDRASAILNEMGEFESASQVASRSLRNEPKNPRALWEKAFALERLWKTEEALELLERIRVEDVPNAAMDSGIRLNHLMGMCRLKQRDVNGLRRVVFRSASRGNHLKLISDRLSRLETALDQSGERLRLRDWVKIMHDRHLLTVYSRRKKTALHSRIEKSLLKDHEGEHDVIRHLSFEDCGEILLALQRSVRDENRKYVGVCSAEPNSLPLAMAVSKLLGLPVVDMIRLAAPESLLICLVSNLGGMGAHISPRWPSRHDLFIMAKGFEREEFRDVVSPPHNFPQVHAWADPILSNHRQIIGALGEYFSFPWEKASLRTCRIISLPQTEFVGEERCRDSVTVSGLALPSRIAERLAWAAMEAQKS